MKKQLWSKSSHDILEHAEGMERYNRWIISNFQKHFGKKIIEIGSGQGGLSKLLPSKAIVVLSDIYDEYLAVLKKKFTDPVIHMDIEHDPVSGLEGKFETVFSSNVLEHIEDDQAALLNTYKLLEKNGNLLLFVPARPEIFGSLDRAMHHFRRYTRKEITTKVEKAGFRVRSVYYANLPGYFIWWARGVLLGWMKSGTRSKETDSYFAKVYDKFIVPLLYLEKYIRPPFGQSLVLIAEKSGK